MRMKKIAYKEVLLILIMCVRVAIPRTLFLIAVEEGASFINESNSGLVTIGHCNGNWVPLLPFYTEAKKEVTQKRRYVFEVGEHFRRQSERARNCAPSRTQGLPVRKPSNLDQTP